MIRIIRRLLCCLWLLLMYAVGFAYPISQPSSRIYTNGIESERSLVFVFNFDQVQIHVSYIDFIKTLTPDNHHLNNVKQYTFKNDSCHIVVENYRLEMKGYDKYTSVRRELFTLIDSKKANLYLSGKMVKSFYTKKVLIKGSRKKYPCYKGKIYYDKETGKHIITNVIFRTFYTIPSPSF